MGLRQVVCELASSWHLNVAGEPLPWKVNVALLALVPAGGAESM